MLELRQKLNSSLSNSQRRREHRGVLAGNSMRKLNMLLLLSLKCVGKIDSRVGKKVEQVDRS